VAARTRGECDERGAGCGWAQEKSIDTPVIHHTVYPAGAAPDAVVLRTGAEIGCSLVDGNGDGVCLEAPGLPLDLLRRTSFGLLQVQQPGEAGQGIMGEGREALSAWDAACRAGSSRRVACVLVAACWRGSPVC
jgi:hypothetical protein